MPRHEPDNPIHARLAELSQEAHAATASGDTGHVPAIEAEIDRLAARVWGLSDEEMREIRTSLAEMNPEAAAPDTASDSTDDEETNSATGTS